MPDLTPFTPIGQTNWRNHNHIFGIKPTDRLYHIFCLGKTGMGKSHLLINMAVDDMLKGYGICVLDPHSDTVEAVYKKVPEHRRKDVIYFDATSRDSLPAFNPLADVPEHQRQLVASEMITTFKRLFSDAWGSKLEYVLRFAIASLMEYPNATLLDISLLLTDASFRAEVLKHVTNPYTKSFWVNEYNMYSASMQASTVQPILNKVGVLLANDTLRGIFGQQQGLSFEQCMNEQKIVLVNLSKGEIGEDVATVLGSFIITSIQNAAMRRASIPITQRKRFYVFIDEAQHFVSTSFAAMLPQVRKFGLGLFLANQHLDQLEPDTRSAILANFGTLIVFRVGLEDAKVMEKQFYPVFTYDDFISLPKYHIYIKLLIDGAESKGFSAVTLNY
ncbi:type IV secretion system DNA-binding domain-containing protein [Mucilaginibacter sp. ZT4R22]|uniref:Type IV secretion system DNA-binding domain-containing protein n=1 Tax=Mucilaginibacter pankratovii TaxID=2772110 RepID=A0ABR7WMD1_9SPHI|nr:type IV secretion system DNA-binding domain-containing protein [Mucilaginibacter pankratovii]MBD1363476.1 type IV secretion system DNA-binding domain-containing protein [Mucilaginibacter pankratovii]